MSQSNNHHRLDYVELGTSSVTLSRDFFRNVFGWEFTDYGPNYTSFKDGRLDGGFTSERSPSNAGPLLVIYSSDLEASLTRIEDEGATIVKPIFSFPGGRRFHFLEPGGNEMAVWGQ